MAREHAVFPASLSYWASLESDRSWVVSELDWLGDRRTFSVAQSEERGSQWNARWRCAATFDGGERRANDGGEFSAWRFNLRYSYHRILTVGRHPIAFKAPTLDLGPLYGARIGRLASRRPPRGIPTGPFGADRSDFASEIDVCDSRRNFWLSFFWFRFD